MLNSSAVLNGQPAILAWSVTSIQLPPETIQACPINQPIRCTAIQESQLGSPSLPVPLPFSPCSLLLFAPSFLTQARCLSRVLVVRASFHLSIPPQLPPVLSPGRLPVPRPNLTIYQSLFTTRAYAPIPYTPLYRQFFSPPSRIRAWGPVRSMKVLPDGARRATYIIVKHAMRVPPS